MHSSHPCETVKKALELKAIRYTTVELLMPTQALITRMRFPSRTVPALRLDGGEKVQGSRAILRRLDELVPDPPLLPDDEAARTAVLDAERWGDELLQPLARRAVWTPLGHGTRSGGSGPRYGRPAAARARCASSTVAGRTSAAFASGSSNSTRAAADWPAPVQLRSIP